MSELGNHLRPNRFERVWADQYPRKVKIEETPPLPALGDSWAKPGDLVRWDIIRGTNQYYYSRMLGAQARGLIIEARWSIVDWSREARGSDQEYYAPEAVVMWNDGTVTSSHQSALKLVSRPKTSRRSQR